jgi:hypothetical protein
MDPVQEALEKSKKTNYFKLTLPHMGSDFKVALWASGIPKQFVLHVQSAIHSCNQMEHDVNCSKAKEAVANATLDLEIKKDEYAVVGSMEKKMTKGNPGAKMAYEKAKQALEAAKLATASEGEKPFKLYVNLCPMRPGNLGKRSYKPK